MDLELDDSISDIDHDFKYIERLDGESEAKPRRDSRRASA